MSSSTGKPLGRIAANRLQKELKEWQLNPPSGFKLHPSDNLQRWIIEVHGAPGTLYANDIFSLYFEFPEGYPMEAPMVIFGRNPPLHPHIYSNGHICLDILYDSWSPAMTVSSICMSLVSMLSSSPVKARPADDERYVKNCGAGRSPKETRWWFHDDTVWKEAELCCVLSGIGRNTMCYLLSNLEEVMCNWGQEDCFQERLAFLSMFY